MADLELTGLNNYDIKAGAIMRSLERMVTDVKNGRNIKNEDYCDFVFMIYPKNSNGKGGCWYFLGKDFLTDKKSGMHQDYVDGLLTYKFYNYNDFKEHYKDKEFLYKLLNEVGEGERNYDIIINISSYHTSTEMHNENRETLRQVMDITFPEFREIK